MCGVTENIWQAKNWPTFNYLQACLMNKSMHCIGKPFFEGVDMYVIFTPSLGSVPSPSNTSTGVTVFEWLFNCIFFKSRMKSIKNQKDNAIKPQFL